MLLATSGRTYSKVVRLMVLLNRDLSQSSPKDFCQISEVTVNLPSGVCERGSGSKDSGADVLLIAKH